MLYSLFRPKAIVVRLFNSLLSQEPWAKERIAQNANKIARFQMPISSLELRLTDDGRVALCDKQNEMTPNVTVTMSADQVPAALKEISGGWANGLDIKALMSHVHIEGEAGLANLVSDLSRDLRWDRHYYLANLLGPVLTSHLIRTERFVLEKGQEAVDTILRAGADSLSYEQEVLIAKVHFNDLNRDLDALTSRLDKLEKTIASSSMSKAVGSKHV